MITTSVIFGTLFSNFKALIHSGNGFRAFLAGESRWYCMRIILVLFVLCHFVAAQQSVRTVFLVRHAEKTSGSADPGLSPAGLKRADCLANTLKDAGIKNIYVSEAKRTQQTADPIAKRIKVKPTMMKAEDSANLVRNLLYAGNGNTLVIGHSDTLPIIAARMKVGTVAPIGENEYDRLIVITTVEGSATPMVTLHYCEASGPAASSPQTVKPAATKTTPKKH
jgi:phosphohistidine phosphatase SixA